MAITLRHLLQPSPSAQGAARTTSVPPQAAPILLDPATQAALNGRRIRIRKSNSTCYAELVTSHNGNRQYIKLHRFLMNAPPRLHVHHINGNPLDNRIINLLLIDPRTHNSQHSSSRTHFSSKTPKNDSPGLTRLGDLRQPHTKLPPKTTP